MKVSVIGQGYVGLTVAIGAAMAGHRVVGLDVNSSLIGDLVAGQSYVPGTNKNQILSLIEKELYTPTIDSNQINDSEIIVIAVPTPLTEEKKPDLSYIHNASELIATTVKKSALIINESTSFPGTLRKIIKISIEEKSEVKFLYAAAPERVDPGNHDWSIKNTPRVISGLTEEATNLACKFYSTFCSSVHKVSSPEVAEASKLFENTFRQINIALANEFSEISNVLGFSANEAITAASTKPFGFMPFYPSIGVGGHCIPVDPTYLSFISESYGVNAKFIELANVTNRLMHKKIAFRLENYLGKSLKNLNVQLAGISYKPDVSDMRESPALDLISELRSLGANVSWHDPLVLKYKNEVSVPLSSNVDLGLVISPHQAIDFTPWRNSGTHVLDLSSGPKQLGWSKFL
jgi:UDP-N-acetyl-D-glucosamine dehydrogenase